jgi:hypothetical protein
MDTFNNTTKVVKDDLEENKVRQQGIYCGGMLLNLCISGIER